MMTASDWPSAHELCATVFELNRGMTQMTNDNEPINGTDLKITPAEAPPPSSEPAQPEAMTPAELKLAIADAPRFAVSDPVRTKAELVERKTDDGTPVPNRAANMAGMILAVRPDHVLRYLVRQEDGTMSAYVEEELIEIEVPKVGVTRWQTYTLDLPWPGPNDHHFEAMFPAPAIFQKAVPMATRSMVDPRAKPELKLKLVFLGCPDAPVVRTLFTLVRSDQIMQVIAAEEIPKPQLLDTILSPLDGEPLALWQMPTGEVMPDVPIVEVPKFKAPINSGDAPA